MKNILIWEVLPIMGGGQTMSVYIGEILKRNYSIKFIIPEEGQLSQILSQKGIPFIKIGAHSLPSGEKRITDIIRYLRNTIRILSRIKSIIEEEKADLLYVGGPIALPWAALIGILMNIPVIWHLHHLFKDKKVVFLLNLIGRLSSVKLIISVSECVAGQIKTGSIRNKQVTLYNPINISGYNVTQAGILRNEIRISPSDKVVGCIGILQPQKRQDLIIESIPEMIESHNNVHYVFIGSPRDDTKSYAQGLYTLVKTLGLGKNVSFLGYRSDIPTFLHELDAVIIPMAEEGCPLVALECFAAGVPIVGIDKGGVKELINISNAGEIFSEKDSSRSLNLVLQKVLFKVPRDYYAENGKSFVSRCDSKFFEERIISIFSKMI